MVPFFSNVKGYATFLKHMLVEKTRILRYIEGDNAELDTTQGVHFGVFFGPKINLKCAP